MRILEKRYLHGETPEQMFRRVARTVAGAHGDNEDEFYWLMSNLYFLPNSPTLMNAGRPLGQLSACFVVPMGDSMEQIFEGVKQMAMIQRSGGGTGFSFSKLRPANWPVSTTRGEASGPVSFMKVFNAATEEIKQGGARRGANMAALSVHHPDILKFIHCKEKEGELSNFNISVMVTDEFMEAARRGEDYELRYEESWLRALPAESPLRTPRKLNAAFVLDEIIEGMWLNGEPGILFGDTINRSNPTPQLGEIDATNPCGEQPLLPWESCNLGSINLRAMVEGRKINWDLLWTVTRLAVRFLDSVIDINNFPNEMIREATLRTRKIGLGVMGWADLLFALRIPYDSEEALSLASKVMEHIKRAAYEESTKLAEERGSYPACTTTPALRNATLTTIAPTGTISMIADVSSGIEPVFALAYTREAVDETLTYVNPTFKQYLVETLGTGPKLEQALEQVAKTGSCRGLGIPEAGRVFKVATEIDPEWHVRMQAAFQQHVDNAVSKTINFPNSATRDDIKRAVWLAYDLKCKGLTVYRDGSRVHQVITAGTMGVNKTARAIEVRERPERLEGFTQRVRTGCGKMYVTVNFKDGRPFETFITTGAAGGCSAFAEGIARMVTLSLRSQVPLGKIVKQLESVSCPNFLRKRGLDSSLQGKSCPDVIGRVLTYALNMQREEKTCVEGPTCPECGSPMEMLEGCVSCRNCGFSKCS